MMGKLKPIVFLEAAIEVMSNNHIGCCDSLDAAENEYEVSDEHSYLFDFLFRPEELATDEYWWSHPDASDGDGPRSLAMLLMHEMCKEHWVPEILMERKNTPEWRDDYPCVY